MRGRTAWALLALVLAIISAAQAQTPSQETLVQKLQEGTSEERQHAAGVLGILAMIRLFHTLSMP